MYWSLISWGPSRDHLARDELLAHLDNSAADARRRTEFRPKDTAIKKIIAQAIAKILLTTALRRLEAAA